VGFGGAVLCPQQEGRLETWEHCDGIPATNRTWHQGRQERRECLPILESLLHSPLHRRALGRERGSLGGLRRLHISDVPSGLENKG